MRIAVSRQIDAQVERVFEVFTELDRASERIGGIESVEVLTDGPFGEGTRWTETRRMGGRLASETMTITGFDPPRSYTAEAKSCGAHYTTTLSFDPAGSGTKVTMSFGGVPTNLMARLMMIVMGPLMRGTITKMIAQDLDDLAQVCEAGDRTA